MRADARHRMRRVLLSRCSVCLRIAKSWREAAVPLSGCKPARIFSVQRFSAEMTEERERGRNGERRQRREVWREERDERGKSQWRKSDKKRRGEGAVNGVRLSLVCCHGAGSVGAAARWRFAAQLANYPLTAVVIRSSKNLSGFPSFFSPLLCHFFLHHHVGTGDRGCLTVWMLHLEEKKKKDVLRRAASLDVNSGRFILV